MTGPAARGVHHVAITVRDLAAVEAFYRQTLGLTVLRRWPLPGGGERSVWLDTGDGAFLALERLGAEATTAPAHEESAAPGLHLLALRIQPGERELWEQRLSAAGVTIYYRTPFTLYFRDPEGNRVGLSHWPDEATD